MEHTTEPTAERLWDDVSGRLQETLNETTYATWFGDVSAGDLADDAFSLVVPNDFTREWIEGHFLGFVKAAARDAIGRADWGYCKERWLRELSSLAAQANIPVL